MESPFACEKAWHGSCRCPQCQRERIGALQARVEEWEKALDEALAQLCNAQPASHAVPDIWYSRTEALLERISNMRNEAMRGE